MPEEVKKEKITYEIISREETMEITTEGRRILGYRIAFATERIPYEWLFIPKAEWTKEKEREEIAKKIKAYKPVEREVGEVEV